VNQPTPLDFQAVLRAVGDVTDKDVLDIGCGDGLYAAALARSGARVVGLDRSRPVLRAASIRAGEAGARVQTVSGEATSLPFTDEAFDVVVAVTVLCFVKSPERLFEEAARLLRPGGILVVGELGRWSTWALWRRLKGVLGYRTWGAATFWTPGRLRALARGSGLVPGPVTAAVFHPPAGWAASLLSPLDRHIGRFTAVGAAFLVLRAQKPP
jgi:SAM-dependent methyltransferase